MNEHYIRGMAFCQEEKFQEAIKEFDRALLVHPAHLEIIYNRGMAKLSSEQYSAAIQDFDKALELAPRNANIYSQRGVCKHLLKQHEAALRDMDRAVALEPENGYRYSSRAYIKGKMGDVFGAIDDYKMAIQIDPEDAIALNNLGLVEQLAGFKKSAEERFKEADAIADAEKTFERPNLEELLKDVNEGNTPKITLTQPEINNNAPKFRPQPTNKPQQLTMKSYWQTVRKVFTSKETFADFLQFVQFWKKA